MPKNKADKTVMELREDLLKKKAALLASEKPVYIAGEYFRPDMHSNRGEFQVTIASVGQLLSGVKALRHHAESAKVLGMSEDHMGFPVEDWIADFKTKKAVLDRADNLRKVAAIEASLKLLLSKAQLREIGISDLADAVADL